MAREYRFTIAVLHDAQGEIASDQRVDQPEALTHCLLIAIAERLEALVEVGDTYIQSRVASKRTRFSPQEDAAIRRMVHEGFSYAQIADQLGRTRQVVWKHAYETLGLRIKR